MEKAPGRDSEADHNVFTVYTHCPPCLELSQTGLQGTAVFVGYHGDCEPWCLRGVLHLLASVPLTSSAAPTKSVQGAWEPFQADQETGSELQQNWASIPEWIPVSLVKLNTLIIRHNNITSISTDSFSTTPNLKCLDSVIQ